MRAPLFPLLVVLLGCGRDKAPPPSPVAPPESAKPAESPPVAAPPEAAKPAEAPPSSTKPEAAPPQAAAPASGCRALPWKDDENVGEATYEGTVERLLAGVPDLNIVDDTFKLLLDRPVCLPAGSEPAETAEIQFGADDKTEARLRKHFGKKIVITGDGIKAFNAHHHRPIIVYANTMTLVK